LEYKIYPIIHTTLLVFPFFKGGHRVRGLLLRATFFGQLLQALAFCHSQGIVHGDIKPGNLLIHFGEEKLCLIDFGLSFFIQDQKPRRGGTLGYWAPELYLNETLGPTIDVWGAAVVLYEWVPFNSLLSHLFHR
jgi:serine/threonine protein kinase